jgi:hypothetical protein
MRLKAIAAGIFFLASASFALAADPVGHYTVEGNNPDHGANYTGDVTVSKTGQTYKIVWTIGGTKYYGTGIGDENFLAISYKSGSETGLALYGEKDEGWVGIWTYAGGKALGAEKWTRD